jgi:AmmeMemoRadiSam system protein A
MVRLSGTERATLLVLARDAVEARVHWRDLPVPGPLSPRLDEPGAAFVSVHAGGDLRGCLGCIEPRPDASLASTVVRMAAAAAKDDPRFAPLSTADLPEVVVEISVLGPMLPLTGVHEIAIGRDGLVIEQDGRRGLLLPQVATQRGWTAEVFLEETGRKAGLPRTAWREGARVHRFEAEVFSSPAAGLVQ